MKILGLDISTACTGYAVKEDGYIRVGHIKTPYKLKSFSALLYQAENIKKLIEEEKPDIMVIEDTYLKENFKTVKLMNMLRGYVYVYSVFKGIEVHPNYNTVHARRILGLKGINKRGLTRKQRKEKVMQFLASLGYKVEQDDEADALILVLAFEKERRLKWEKPMK